MNGKRVLVTTILGFIFGIVSYLFVQGAEMTSELIWALSFTGPILGFIIGLSGWKINFVIHGILLGAIVYFPIALTVNPFLRYWLLGILYGGLIETIEHFIIRETNPVT
jgi:hypothetical protein